MKNNLPMALFLFLILGPGLGAQIQTQGIQVIPGSKPIPGPRVVDTPIIPPGPLFENLGTWQVWIENQGPEAYVKPPVVPAFSKTLILGKKEALLWVLSPFVTPKYTSLKIWNTSQGPAWAGQDGPFVEIQRPGQPAQRWFEPNFSNSKKSLETFWSEPAWLFKPQKPTAWDRPSWGTLVTGEGRFYVPIYKDFGNTRLRTDNESNRQSGLMIETMSASPQSSYGGSTSNLSKITYQGKTVFQGITHGFTDQQPGTWGVLGQKSETAALTWITPYGTTEIPKGMKAKTLLRNDPWTFYDALWDSWLFKDSKPRWKFHRGLEGIILGPDSYGKKPGLFLSSSGKSIPLPEGDEYLIGFTKSGVPLYASYDDITLGQKKIKLPHIWNAVFFVKAPGETEWTCLKNDSESSSTIVFIDEHFNVIVFLTSWATPGEAPNSWQGLQVEQTSGKKIYKTMEFTWQP